MDFEEFNELLQRKDDNVINLKCTDIDDEKEEKEQVGKNKVFDFNSSSNSVEKDISDNDIGDKKQTVEELLREINEVSQQANPHMRKQVYHQRRNRYQTTLEFSQQIHQFNTINSNRELNLDTSKQLEQIQEKLSQNRIRMPSYHSTLNNITSQSSMHTINNGNERERLGSGDNGTNYFQIRNENTKRRVQTQPFVLSKNQLYSTDEIDSKEIINIENNLNGNNQGQEQINNLIDQFQRRQQFKRNSSKQNSNGRKLKGENLNDSQMLISITIDHNNENNNFLGYPIKANAEEDNYEEGGEGFIHKQLKGIHQKLYTKQVSLLDQTTELENEEENKNNQVQQQLDQIQQQNKGEFQSPKYKKVNTLSPTGRIQSALSPQNKRQSTQSPQSKRQSKQQVKINDQKQDLYDNYVINQHKQVHEFRQRTITNVIYEQASEQNCQTFQQSQQVQNQRQQPPEQKQGRLSNGSLSQFQLKPTHNNLPQSLYSTKMSFSSTDNKKEKTSNDDEVLENGQISLGQFGKDKISDQQLKFITNKMKLIRSSTALFDQEKKINLYKKVEEMSTNHNHVVQNDQPQDGCIACEFQQLMKQNNNPKDKQPELQEIIDINKLFKEIPLHVIESKFFLRQVSLLKQNHQEIADQIDGVFVLKKKNNCKLTALRVYFFAREDTFIDFQIDIQNTSISEFVKLAIQSYKIKSNLNQNLLKYPEQPKRYKIYPNVSQNKSEIFMPNMDIPEPSDDMMIDDVLELENSNINACCFVDIDEFMESISVSQTIDNGPELDLKEFQNVYNKQYVFKIEFKEKDYYTFLRLGKDKNVEDIFDDLQKKKKIDIDKRNYIIVGRIVGNENSVTLDLNMPLSIIIDPCLKIQRREYEDRQGGTIDENELTIITDNNILNCYTTEQDDSMNQMDDDIDEDDDNNDEIDYQQKMNINKLNIRKGKRQFTQLNYQLDSTQLMKYEEFEVIKESIQIQGKKSKRIVGIDENFIYNRKMEPKLFSLRGLFCFLFPASTSDTKCPQKKIDDIKYMYIIEGERYTQIMASLQSKSLNYKENVPKTDIPKKE